MIIGYTYSKALGSFKDGLIWAIPINFLGMLAGAITAFVVSRYFLKDFVSNKIE